MSTNPVYLGLGSNLGDREAALRSGLLDLERGGVSIRAVSSVYETDPVGFFDQPTFLNLAVEAQWAGGPESLLERCRRAEERLHRVRGERDGPRTLDVDILLMGDLVLGSADLLIPHPRMSERRFVLVPLSEIAPDAVHPGSNLTIRELLRRCPDDSRVQRTGPFHG